MVEANEIKTLPHPADVDAIVFDFGGVLFNIDYDAPARAFNELGWNSFTEVYSQAAQSTLFDRLETGKISNDDFLAELHAFLPQGVSRQQVLDAWNVILLDIPTERIALIHDLKDRYRTFLLSNTNAIHVAEFEKTIDRTMGIDYFRAAFERIYYSNVIGIKKPYPETFLEVCKWNDLTPHRTLFIDDSVQHVIGAHRAGLRAYHLDITTSDIRDVLAHF
ncbi:MAG: hypothetical protein RL226_1953 [Bacteroidota bacterium]